MKTPPVLARKLEEIQCHSGEQTNNLSLSRSHSFLFNSCWAGGADCLLIKETVAVNPKKEHCQAQRKPMLAPASCLPSASCMPGEGDEEGDRKAMASRASCTRC